MEAEGIIEPLQFSEWASPIVPVVKSDKKSVRICGDFSLTVNRVSKLDKYPIPKIEDLFAQLSGGKRYTKLDMSQAYQQIVLDKDSRKFVVVNTHRGLFQIAFWSFFHSRYFPTDHGVVVERHPRSSHIHR